MATKKGGKVSGKGTQGGDVGQGKTYKRPRKGGKVKGPRDHGSEVGKRKKSAKKR